MAELDIITAHAGASCLKEAHASWLADTGIHALIVDGHDGILHAYEQAWRQSKADVIAYLHDDCVTKEKDWHLRVLAEFESPDVGLIGFGGALVHGSPELYKRPYDHRQLGRSHYMSNVDDAEVHGARFTGSNDVATLDGFALIVRRDILERAGGWPVGVLDYIMYDQWLTCMAHRLGYRVRVVGVRCHHLGGRTAVTLKKADETGVEYDKAHRYIYNEFRDVLPWSCLP